jgi:hypothetical protein
MLVVENPHQRLYFEVEDQIRSDQALNMHNALVSASARPLCDSEAEAQAQAQAQAARSDGTA